MQKIRNVAGKLADVRALLGGSLMVSAAFAHAELPPEATAAFLQVKTDAGSMISEAWPLLVAVTVGFVLMKLFKRGVNKAT